jgi:peptidoglycan/xylan/chitin deacetylase (PgdA/CDA1 family)
VSHVLYWTGLLRIWQTIAMRDKAVVLMYHRVLTAEERKRTGSHPALVVDRDTFARQMQALKRWFRVLSEEEFAEQLARRAPFPRASCVITFDDGWRDNFTNALPILDAHQLPALIFLPVNYIGRQRIFWQEGLTHLLLRVTAEVRADPSRRHALQALLASAGIAHVTDITGVDPRPQILAVVASLKALTRTEMGALIDALARELGVSMDDFAQIDGFIDWAQVAEMTRKRIAFGGHGAEHLLLTHVSPEEVVCEMRTARQVLEERLGQRLRSFSYPNGYFTPGIVNTLQACGYRLGFSTDGGLVTCDDDPLTVRRFNVHEAMTGSTPMFLARAVGLW